jgi:predicted N-formylglutamate amidohydrolase
MSRTSHAAQFPGSQRPFVLVSCEHAVNTIPPRWQHLFVNKDPLLNSHCGYDAGAWEVAQLLSQSFAAPLHGASTSRLLLDHNRSPHHPALFSPLSKVLGAAQRRELIDTLLIPYRQSVATAIEQALKKHPWVLHLSVHSFTPRLRGEQRRADIGLLYDPAREREAGLCKRWQAVLRQQQPWLCVRRNYPYRGTSDGLTRWLRSTIAPQRYAGIELEMNQRFVRSGGERWVQFYQAIRSSLGLVIGEYI